LIQISKENDDSNFLIEKRDGEKNIVILFPMTRGIDTNLPRWQKLISTVNSSNVAALVLIDKTPMCQATNYFVEKEKEILTDIFIIQRPRTEPIHDSQSRVRLKDNLWIIQLHDDDEWDGTLEIPFGTNENSIIKTHFSIVNDDLTTNVDNPNWPDCRSIFSLLPAKVWNRFVDLIIEQGGHVAGSIDSSLNLPVSLIRPSLINPDFRYYYDNRHWNSKRHSKEHLIQLTKEDGWEKFATVHISLVSRAIDGIASLIYFSDLYSDIELEVQLKKWIEATKPHTLRIFSGRVEILSLMFLRGVLGFVPKSCSHRLMASLSMSVLYRRILLSIWDASEVKDYLSSVEIFMEIGFLAQLQSRFKFWDTQLKKYTV
jgi:hypothetical protein